MIKKQIISSIIVAMIIFNNICLAQDIYVWSTTQDVSSSLSENTQSVENNNSLNLQSESAILIEQTTGQILYAHNEHESLRPASVTKLMSILLIMEQIEMGKLTYDTKISCSTNAAGMGGSQIWLSTNETLTVDEMLKAICVVSANDCVVAMAEHIAGSEEAFVEMMNAKAKSLEMNDTTFKNCHGLDEDGHLTSSYDIALMSKELLNKYPEITNYTSIYMDTLRDGASELVNTNKLVKNYEGCTGLKTGSTGLALYNFSASATRDGLSLIAVIMKGPTSSIRFEEAQKLLDYGFNNFEYKQFACQGEKIKDVEVSKGTETKVEAVFEKNVGILIEKGTSSSISQTITIKENIIAPIAQGERIGEVTYSLNDDTLATVNIIASKDVKKMNMFAVSIKLYSKWLNLLR